MRCCFYSSFLILCLKYLIRTMVSKSQFFSYVVNTIKNVLIYDYCTCLFALTWRNILYSAKMFLSIYLFCFLKYILIQGYHDKQITLSTLHITFYTVSIRLHESIQNVLQNITILIIKNGALLLVYFMSLTFSII